MFCVRRPAADDPLPSFRKHPQHRRGSRVILAKRCLAVNKARIRELNDALRVRSEYGQTMSERRDDLPSWLGHLMCRLGMHDFQLIEVTGDFGQGGSVEKVECRRCKHRATRRSRPN